MMASLSHIYIVDPGTAWSVLDFWTDDTVFCNDPSSGCPFQRPPQRMPPFFLFSLLPQLKHLKSATASVTLHYRLIILADWHIGWAPFTSPTWHLNWRHPAPETKYNPPSSKLHATRRIIPTAKPHLVVSVSSVSFVHLKKKKTFPLKEGRMTTWSLKWIKKCVFVFTSVISRVGRKGGEKMSWKRLCDW